MNFFIYSFIAFYNYSDTQFSTYLIFGKNIEERYERIFDKKSLGFKDDIISHGKKEKDYFIIFVTFFIDKRQLRGC